MTHQNKTQPIVRNHIDLINTRVSIFLLMLVQHENTIKHQTKKDTKKKNERKEDYIQKDERKKQTHTHTQNTATSNSCNDLENKTIHV